MLKRVDLIYHPIQQAAQLQIDGEPFNRPGSRIQKMIVGRPMEQWLQPMTDSYRLWRGFLPELAAEINEDRLWLVFSGTPKDYEQFERVIREQKSRLAESNFHLLELEIEHKESFTQRQILEKMCALRLKWRAEGLTARLIRERDVLDQQLAQCGTNEDAYRLIDEYILLLKEAQHAASETGESSNLIQMRRAWEALKQGE